VKAKAEVVIIGAGIMGASLAYFLAKKGKRNLQRYRRLAVALRQAAGTLRKAGKGLL